MARPLTENPSAVTLRARLWRERHPDRERNAEKQRVASLKWRNANIELARRNAREWSKKNPQKVREKLWRRQGMSLKWPGYIVLLESQSYRCANDGCGATLNQSSPVDHDHETGLIRGVLCKACNNALGMLVDSQERILGLSRYLARVVTQ